MRLGIWVAGALAALGIGWAVLAVRPWAHPSGSGTVPPLVNPADVAAAKAAKPNPPSDLAMTLVSFEESLTSAADALPPELSLDMKARKEFVALAQERLELLLDPSYDRYLAQVARLTGHQADSEKLKGLVWNRDKWELYAKHFRGLPVDLAGVEIRPVTKSGHELPLNWAGHTTVTYPAEGLYTSFGHRPPDPAIRTDAYEVWIPARINDADTGQPVTVFLVMGFVRFPASNRWFPWRIGFNDPTGEAAMITPPI